MTWIKFTLIELPYYDPRTGEALASIEGRRNRPDKDPFEGGGKVYPPLPENIKVLSRQERGTTLMLLVGDEDAEDLKAMTGKATYQATPMELREYDLSEHNPVERTDTEALEDLKRDIGWPDKTSLDLDGCPVIVEESGVTE